MQLLTSFQTYIGFVDGACRSTRNISSVGWAIYSPTDDLVSMHGVCLGQTTNNIREYSAVIELLSDAISFGILSLIIRLDLELIVLHLNNVYAIRNPMLLRLFLKVRLLERKFDYIEYQYISKNLNTLADALDNRFFNRNLQHQQSKSKQHSIHVKQDTQRTRVVISLR